MLDVIYIFQIFFGNWKVKTEQMSFNALYENVSCYKIIILSDYN